MPRYVVLNKRIGQTPLDVISEYKAANPEFSDVPMAYAGRLDPMAEGKLLILIGDECKVQERYHSLDKEYEFEVLFGASSDTGDVLGLLSLDEIPSRPHADKLREISTSLTRREISLPYPHFSSKTVKGKPLHVWSVEGRIGEIEIPIATTRIHTLALLDLRQLPADAVYRDALQKINSFPPVTDPSKELGNDFRRTDVRVSWSDFLAHFKGTELSIARFRCISSSGTYMRSLAEHIGELSGSRALAFSIKRTTIGTYRELPFGVGFWSKKYS